MVFDDKNHGSKIAKKHGSVRLLHKKPFAGVNGSGKL